jgi:hypothetical protein
MTSLSCLQPVHSCRFEQVRGLPLRSERTSQSCETEFPAEPKGYRQGSNGCDKLTMGNSFPTVPSRRKANQARTVTALGRLATSRIGSPAVDLDFIHVSTHRMLWRDAALQINRAQQTDHAGNGLLYRAPNLTSVTIAGSNREAAADGRANRQRSPNRSSTNPCTESRNPLSFESASMSE